MYSDKRELKQTSGSTFIRNFLLPGARLFVPVLLVVASPFVWRQARTVLDGPVCPSYGGDVHPDFEDVKTAFGENIMTGYDKGAAFSVYYQGQPLVDLWGGCADQAKAKVWTRDTLTQAWSSTKGVTAIALGVLVGRGRLNTSRTVASYWPEFAQNGKENITVGMLLSHQAGLSNLQRVISLMEYRDEWSLVEDMLATQAPLWTPGTLYNYHALTYGMYADALVRKVDEKHRTLSKFFKEEIADVFGLDFYIGLPRERHARTTQATYSSLWNVMLGFFTRFDNWKSLPRTVKYNDILIKSMQAVDFVHNMEVMNEAEMRDVGLSSSHGFGTARSLAQMYDYIANNGTVRGQTLVHPDIVAQLAFPLTKNIPVILLPKYPFSPLGSNIEPNRNGLPTVGHRGYGGQHAYSDMQFRVGVAYLTNSNFGSGEIEDPRLTKILDALYKCLDRFQKTL